MKPYGLSFADVFCVPNGEPIVNSLLDMDFYKWSMSSFIYDHPEYRDVRVTFSLIIRGGRVRLAEVIPLQELRAHLDDARRLTLRPAERSFLAGMTMSDGRSRVIRSDAFLDEFARPVLPPYVLRRQGPDYVLTFAGEWWKVTFWEIVAMTIVSELYYYHLVKRGSLSGSELASIYVGMMARLREKVMLLRDHPEVAFSEFGTRRRHSRHFQEFSFGFISEMLPGQCIGTSNVLLAMQHGSDNPKGTNAHELYMVEACLAGDDRERIFTSPFRMAQKWYDYYGKDMSVLLPDTFGTRHFYRHAPKSMATEWKGPRLDSMEPNEAIELTVEWWKRHGVDPKTKMVFPSDGLDAETMVDCTRRSAEKVGLLSYGTGTFLTNDCRGLWPKKDGISDMFAPFSMVCKVSEANGVPAVKLSDNPEKATGPADRVAMFREIFGTEGTKSRVVVV